ncbi:MAG: C-terminal binding protein [Acidimicrobiia bacterium]|nr:C-terminal binding protein [Acidimicrobiia bacterium]MDH4308997.1 C-terminal binding protein [Acidimicrobiia bacterium]
MTTLVAVADTVFPTLDPARKALEGLDVELVIAEEPTPEAVLAVAADADALFVTYGQITADIIGGLNRCKVIGRFGIGTDNIDLRAAADAGIVVTYAPVYCLDEVSDHAMALLLTLARKTAMANTMVHGGRWEMPAVVPIHRLRGRTLGLVGLGNIPQKIVPKAQAFGIDVIASDPYAPDEVFERLNVRRVDFEELLETSDFVSVHAPLTAETQGMFNTEVFSKMKSTALLVNTARGPLVNVEDLAKALDGGQIAGAALDVLPVEPPPVGMGLLGRDNVILTPHTAFYSEDALLDLQTTVATDVATVLRGGTPKFPVRLPT